MKMGLAPLPFSLSQAACLLLPTSLVVDEHAPRLGHACRFSARTLHAALPAVLPATAAAAAALPKLPKLQNTSQSLTPPSNRSHLFDRKMRRWHRAIPQTQRYVLFSAEDTVQPIGDGDDEVRTQDLSKLEDEMPKLQLLSK